MIGTNLKSGLSGYVSVAVAVGSMAEDWPVKMSSGYANSDQRISQMIPILAVFPFSE